MTGRSTGAPKGGARAGGKMARYKSSGTALTAINEGDEYCTLQVCLCGLCIMYMALGMRALRFCIAIRGLLAFFFM